MRFPKIASMSMEEGKVGEISDIHMEGSSVNPEKQLSDTRHGSNGNFAKENGLHDDNPLTETSHEQLVQMVIELKLQNEFLKSQFEGLKNLQSADDESRQRTEASDRKTVASAVTEGLHQRIESLSRELHEEKQTRGQILSVYSEVLTLCFEDILFNYDSLLNSSF